MARALLLTVRADLGRLVRFGIVGLSGYAVTLAVFAVLHHAGAARLVAAVGAFAAGVTNNFWWNRSWTFAARGAGAAHRQAARFLAVSGGAFLFTAAVLELTARSGVPALAAEALAIVVATPLSFAANRAWTFAPVAPAPPEPAPAGPVAGSVWLVLPTYDEAENIEPVVRAALPRLRDAAREAHVLVVDDGSPDGTGAIADRLAREDPAVEVLHRPRKEGLGRAYLAGFDRALRAGADLVVEMDADLSHDPDDIPRLVAATRDCDLAIGSRYVAGGAVPGWSVPRRLVSRLGGAYARAVLGLGVRDLTGGYKCFRRAALDGIDLAGVRNAGYGFQIEVTYRVAQAGFRVRELPIVFAPRRAGASKMTLRIALEALWRVPALRLRGGPPRRRPARRVRWRRAW